VPKNYRGSTDGRGSSVDLILQAAADLLAEHGEGGFKMNDVIERSGCSTGTIYYYFGSRQRLVDAVRAMQFDPQADTRAANELQRLGDALEAATTPEELLAPVTEFLQSLTWDQDLDELWKTVDFIGLAHSKPGVREVVADSLKQQTETYAAGFALLQEKGLVDPALDPWAVAVFVQAFMVGRIIGMIDGTENLKDQAWNDVVMRFLGSLMVQG